MKFQASLIVHGRAVDDAVSGFLDTKEAAELAGQELVDSYDPEHVKRHGDDCWRDYRIDEHSDAEAAELSEPPEPLDCPLCQGTGEGQIADTVCHSCHGFGVDMDGVRRGE